MAEKKKPIKTKPKAKAKPKLPAKPKPKPKPKAKPKARVKPKLPAKPKAKPVAPEDRPLTDKQKLFVKWYVSDIVNLNGTEAARRARYKGSDNVLAVVAHENLRKPNIRKAVDAALEQAGKDAGITVESTLRKLSQIRELAIEKGQLSPAARCTEAQGRYLKMFTDRIEHVSTIDDLSLSDLKRLLQQIQEESGIDLAALTAGADK